MSELDSALNSPLSSGEEPTEHPLPRCFRFTVDNTHGIIQHYIHDPHGRIVIFRAKKVTENPTVPGGASTLILVQANQEHMIARFSGNDPIGTIIEMEFIAHLDEEIQFYTIGGEIMLFCDYIPYDEDISEPEVDLSE